MKNPQTLFEAQAIYDAAKFDAMQGLVSKMRGIDAKTASTRYKSACELVAKEITTKQLRGFYKPVVEKKQAYDFAFGFWAGITGTALVTYIAFRLMGVL